MTVRAVQAVAFGGPEVLEVRSIAEPDVQPGSVIVTVSVAPVLFLDIQIRAGLARDWFPITPPYVPGAGVAGTVSAIGDDLDESWIGRRVVADTGPGYGGYTEAAAVLVDGLIEVPESVGLPDAAALLHDGRTALGLIEVVRPRPGERVLVTGAGGGLGLLLVQLAHGAGATVIGAARGEKKLARAHECGADLIVDYTEPDWSDKVAAFTGGTGPDVVLDGVGGEIGRAAYLVTAQDGRFSAHGSPAGGFAPIDPADAERRGIALSGIERVQFAPGEAKRLTADALAQAAAGRIKPIIGQSLPLGQAGNAHRDIEARRVIGKSLLEI